MAAYPDEPGAQAPGPHETHNSLIDALHRAIRAHPSAEAKALYGKSLASFLTHQAKVRAAAGQADQHAVGGGPQQDDGAGAPGQQAGQVIQTLTGGPGGGPSYYGDPQQLPPVVAALGGLPAHTGFGPAAIPESGLLGAILAAAHSQHPFSAWAG